MLQNVRFFFMKDEGTTTELSGYPIEGVIEKPINFFRVHQIIDKEDSLPDLKITRKTEEKKKIQEIQSYTSQEYSPLSKEKTNMLESELKKILFDSIENMKNSVVDRMAPLISHYIEDYAKKILNDAAEKVIRAEMDRLLSILRESRK